MGNVTSQCIWRHSRTALGTPLSHALQLLTTRAMSTSPSPNEWRALLAASLGATLALAVRRATHEGCSHRDRTTWADTTRVFRLRPRSVLHWRVLRTWLHGKLFGGGADCVDATTGAAKPVFTLRADAYERHAPQPSLQFLADTLDIDEWNGRVHARLEKVCAGKEVTPDSLGDCVRDMVGQHNVSSGNVVRFPHTCFEAFEWRRSLLFAAKHTVLVSMAYMSADNDALSLVRALAAAARRGVRVFVQLDNFGGDSFVFSGRDPRYGATSGGAGAIPDFLGLVGMLQAAGCHVHFWRPLRSVRGQASRGCGAKAGDVGTAAVYDAKNHAKLWVVDSAVAIVSDRNIGSCYFRNTSYSSTEAAISGPAVAAAEQHFWQLWCDGCGPMPAAAVRANTATAATARALMDALDTPVDDSGVMQTPAMSSPGHRASNVWCAVVGNSASSLCDGEDPIMLALTLAVRAARVSVDLQFAYMVLMPGLVEEVARACRRGVNVRIITNCRTTNDLWWISAASLASILPALRAGAAFFTPVRNESGSGHVHAKVAVVDDRFVLLGSWNAWLRSVFYETELDVLLDCPSLAQAAAAQMDTLLASPVYRQWTVEEVEAAMAADPDGMDAFRSKVLACVQE